MSLLILITGVTLVSTVSSFSYFTTCFLPNGTVDAGNNGAEKHYYNTCNNTGTSVSMCCRTTDASGRPAETCRPDGLCADTNGEIWRNGCTDPSWQDPACVKLCMSGSGIWPGGKGKVGLPCFVDGCAVLHRLGVFGWLMCCAFIGGGSGAMQWANVDAPVTDCGDGSFCCGDSNPNNPANFINATDCCAQKKGVPISNSNAKSSSSTASSSTTTSPSSSQNPGSTSTTGPTTSAQGNSTSSSTSHSGAIAGAVVGGIAIVALIGLALGLLATWRRRKRNIGQEKEEFSKAELGAEFGAKAMVQSGELDGEGRRGELYGEAGRGELEGEGGKVELMGDPRIVAELDGG